MLEVKTTDETALSDAQITGLESAVVSAERGAVLLRATGEVGVGEVKLLPGETLRQAKDRLSAMFQENAWLSPPVSSVSIEEPNADQSAVMESVALIEGKSVVETFVTPSSTSSTASASAVDSDSAAASPTTAAAAPRNNFPRWAPSLWEMRALGKGSGDTRSRKVVTWLSWDKDRNANPGAFPDDWGWEVDLSQTNGGSSWARPFCNPVDLVSDQKSPFTGFWAANGSRELGLVQERGWVTNLPNRVHPYLDRWIVDDTCNRLSLAFGVRYPKTIWRGNSPGDQYGVAIEYDPGTVESSVMSANISAISDDCGRNTPPSRATYCMGLNVGRDFPSAHGAQTQTLVASTRKWSVPACFLMRDEWAGPYRYSRKQTIKVITDKQRSYTCS